MPPSSSAPSTMSTGAEGPTAAASAAEVGSAAESAPISSVTRPRASVTVSLVRVGSRAPSNSPMLEPISTVPTLTAVPKPGNTTNGSDITGADRPENSPAHRASARLR